MYGSWLGRITKQRCEHTKKKTEKNDDWSLFCLYFILFYFVFNISFWQTFGNLVIFNDQIVFRYIVSISRFYVCILFFFSFYDDCFYDVRVFFIIFFFGIETTIVIIILVPVLIALMQWEWYNSFIFNVSSYTVKALLCCGTLSISSAIATDT